MKLIDCINLDYIRCDGKCITCPFDIKVRSEKWKGSFCARNLIRENEAFKEQHGFNLLSDEALEMEIDIREEE